MCHDIEDPTFDATAGATNPYAQVRPIHRPPRVPDDRAPHCHWRVVIDESGDARRAAPDDGGRRRVGDRPDRDRRSRSRRGAGRLVRLLRRVRSRLHARGPLAPRARGRAARVRGADAPPRARVPLLRRESLGPRGSARERAAGVRRARPASCAARLPAVLGITGDDAEAIAKLLQLHPVFQPRTYVSPVIDVLDDADRSLRARSTRPASTSKTASRGSRRWRPSRRRRSTRSRAPLIRARRALRWPGTTRRAAGLAHRDRSRLPSRPRRPPPPSSRASPPARPSRSCRDAICATDALEYPEQSFRRTIRLSGQHFRTYVR